MQRALMKYRLEPILEPSITETVSTSVRLRSQYRDTEWGVVNQPTVQFKELQLMLIINAPPTAASTCHFFADSVRCRNTSTVAKLLG